MTKDLIVGVDIGGTGIKVALLNTNGDILHKSSEPTPVAAGEDSVISKIVEMTNGLLQKENASMERVVGIGIGVPGPVEADTGVVLEAVNLHWKNTPLKAKVEGLTGVPAYVDNDANAAALGEMWRGAGQGAKDLVAVTIGTGVGGGVIIGGEIVHGVSGVGGEIGHMTIVPEGGPQCNCGKTGCLETLSSATAIIREGEQAARSGESTALAAALEAKGKLTAKDVFDAALAGDTGAVGVVDRAAFYLGFGMSHLGNVLNPAKIVIGGGVSAAGEFLFSRIRESFDKYTWAYAAENCEILPATLGNDAGVIGAGWLVRAKMA
ncbi:ROK family glucokinase [Brevibacillus dissolubilis]|uniref:ROK family glucokinase n=1 Tax=Brevibacillus dissolubilis TaxID=1844116 RepID=UPI001116188D|nr:ROK family glucokinase [Brevibacillus dissolubilis]